LLVAAIEGNDSVADDYLSTCYPDRVAAQVARLPAGIEDAAAIGGPQISNQPTRGFPLDHQVSSAGSRVNDADLRCGVPADENRLAGTNHHRGVSLPRLSNLELGYGATMPGDFDKNTRKNGPSQGPEMTDASVS
jgi:hypothetical protein